MITALLTNGETWNKMTLRNWIYALITLLIPLFLAVLVISCTPRGGSSKAEDHSGKYVKIEVDGTECIVPKNYPNGGISCNWRNRQNGD